MSSPNYMYGKIPAEAPDAEWVRRDYKFNEENLINEIKRYIDQTYEGHYSKNQFQSSEFIMDCGLGMGFFLGNVLKYAQRYGKKDGNNRADILKIVHYGLLALNCHDEQEKKTNQELDELGVEPMHDPETEYYYAMGERQVLKDGQYVPSFEVTEDSNPRFHLATGAGYEEFHPKLKAEKQAAMSKGRNS